MAKAARRVPRKRLFDDKERPSATAPVPDHDSPAPYGCVPAHENHARQLIVDLKLEMAERVTRVAEAGGSTDLVDLLTRIVQALAAVERAQRRDESSESHPVK